MCGCKQGLCKGGCPCGCKHTWPPSWEDVYALYEIESRNLDQWVKRCHELLDENAELKEQLQNKKCEHDLRNERIDAWLDRVNAEARETCRHGTEFAYNCEPCEGD